MGILTRLFGDIGIVRFEGESVDGRKLSGSVTIESLGMTTSEIEEKLKNMIFVKEGIKMRTLHIVAFYET